MLEKWYDLAYNSVKKIWPGLAANQPRRSEDKKIMNALMSVDEAAELLSISKWTVRDYIRSGRLRPVRLGRRVLLSEAELERLVAENQQPAQGGTQ